MLPPQFLFCALVLGLGLGLGHGPISIAYSSPYTFSEFPGSVLLHLPLPHVVDLRYRCAVGDPQSCLVQVHANVCVLTPVHMCVLCFVESRRWVEADFSGETPCPREGHSLTRLDDRHVLLFGGMDDIRQLSDGYILDLSCVFDFLLTC